MIEIYLLLDNVRSVYNVGSILRTADAAGVEKVYLSGFTPTPVDRFGRKRRDLAKVALGAENSVAWEYADSTTACIKELKEREVRVVAVEQSTQSINLYSFVQTESTAFVFGNEVEGVSKEVLKLCDEIIEIPMHGTKESLNVSVSAGIVLFCSSLKTPR